MKNCALCDVVSFTVQLSVVCWFALFVGVVTLPMALYKSRKEMH